MTIKTVVVLAVIGGVGYGVFNHYHTNNQYFRWRVWKAKVAAREWWDHLAKPIGPSEQEMAEWDERHLENLKTQIGTSNAAGLQRQRIEQGVQDMMVGPGPQVDDEDRPSAAYPGDAYPGDAYSP